MEASALPGCDTITLALPTVSLTIQPGAPLPTIVDPVVIDGTTQPGHTGSPFIEIDGSNDGMNGDGLRITAGGSTVRRSRSTASVGSVDVLDDRAAAIRLDAKGGNVIEGSHLATHVAGAVALTSNRVFLDPAPSCPVTA